ncbi:MAG: glycosyltransferase [Patescibacteria group bacterium]
MTSTLILIPTYNESENVNNLYRKIKKTKLRIDILFVDDNSPDGTAQIIRQIIRNDKSVHLLLRKQKAGIGGAHLAGIDWAYKKKYKTLITMDCDLTHKPEEIRKLLKMSHTYDIVLGSRYLSKKSLSEWNLFRKILTLLAHILTKTFLSVPYDATGAFRIYKINNIPLAIFKIIESKDYSFFFESIYIFHLNKFRIKEVSISLPSRTYGHSKMTAKDASNSLVFLLKTFYLSRVYIDSYLYIPKLFTGKLNPGKTEKEWDEYWRNPRKKRKILYDTIAVFYRKYIIRRYLNYFINKTFKKNQKILHAGCGAGQVDTNVVKKVKITALDISSEALNRYKNLHGSSCEILYGDIFKIPSRKNIFNGIYNLGVMEHFSEIEIKKILDEFHRVLKKKGKILLFWPPQFGLSVIFLNSIHFILNNLFQKKVRLHPHEITKVKSKKQIKNILSKSGFKLLRFNFGLGDFFTYVVITAEKI